MIIYNKFFKFLSDKNLTSSELYKLCGIHPATIAKMRKGENIETDSINKICAYFNCQPGDIMNYIAD